MYKLIRYNLYLQQQRNVMFVQCMLSFPYENNEFKFFLLSMLFIQAFTCLFVCTYKTWQRLSFHVCLEASCSISFQNKLRNCYLLIFFFLLTDKLNIFFSKDNCKFALCFGNQKQEKGKEWIVNKILQGFLVFKCCFYEICI